MLAAVDNEPGLVTRGCEVHGLTLLHWACFGGQAGVIRSLLYRKANMNQRSNTGEDALMVASLKATAFSSSS